MLALWRFQSLGFCASRQSCWIHASVYS
ncbi:hypothetical protein ACMD2_12227 [Ananas comosus]|uniref:Uncharacterized protein n=1 Tax=Ananas comosus TaxID=4615 RepID=A0A199UCY4_ANACO|nr:hypothetical protein ACMD2_12227 [Ananas comosus]